MRGAGAAQRGSAHLSWPRLCVHTMTARSPCSPAPSAPRPLHLPPDASLRIFSPKFASARVWASARLPRHIIFVFFFTLHHPNLQPKIVLSCTRAASCEPGCFSPTCQWYLSAVKIERGERGEERPSDCSALVCTGCSLVCSPLTGSAQCSVHPGDIFINSEIPAGFVSLAPQHTIQQISFLLLI